MAKMTGKVSAHTIDRPNTTEGYFENNRPGSMMGIGDSNR